MIERKEDVVSWFKQLESYKRIDTMCTLLQMCLPFELRFLGTYLEELGSRDSQELRGIELRVNNPTDLAQEITACQLGEPTDQRIRRKMALYLALIRTSNRKCCNELFKTLNNWGDRDLLIGSDKCAVTTAEDLFQELLLVYTMATNHPVFSFKQRSKCAEIFAQIIKQSSENAYCHANSTGDGSSGVDYYQQVADMSESPPSSPSPSPSSDFNHLQQQQNVSQVHLVHQQHLQQQQLVVGSSVGQQHHHPMTQIPPPNLQQPPPPQSLLIPATSNNPSHQQFLDQQQQNVSQQHLIQLQQQQQQQQQQQSQPFQTMQQHIHPHHQLVAYNQPIMQADGVNQAQQISLVDHQQYQQQQQQGTPVYHDISSFLPHNIAWPQYRHQNATVDTSIPPPQMTIIQSSTSSSPLMISQSSSPNQSRTASPIRGVSSSSSATTISGQSQVRSSNSSGNMGQIQQQQQQHIISAPRRSSRRQSGDQTTPPPQSSQHHQQVVDGGGGMKVVYDEQQFQQQQNPELYLRNGYARPIMGQNRHSKGGGNYVQYQQAQTHHYSMPQQLPQGFMHQQVAPILQPYRIVDFNTFKSASTTTGGSESGGSNSNDDLSPPETPSLPNTAPLEVATASGSSVQHRLLNKQQSRVNNNGATAPRLDKNSLVQLQLASGAGSGQSYVYINSNASPNSNSNIISNSDLMSTSGNGSTSGASPTPMVSVSRTYPPHHTQQAASSLTKGVVGYGGRQSQQLMHNDLVTQMEMEAASFPYAAHFVNHPHHHPQTLIRTSVPPSQIASPPPSLHTLSGVAMIPSILTPPPPQHISYQPVMHSAPQQPAFPPPQQQQQVAPVVVPPAIKSCFNCGSQQHSGSECKETSMEDAIRHYKLDFNSQLNDPHHQLHHHLEETSENEENASSSRSRSSSSSRGSSSCSTTNNASETEQVAQAAASTSGVGVSEGGGGPAGVWVNNSFRNNSHNNNRSSSISSANSVMPVGEISQSLSNLGLSSSADTEVGANVSPPAEGSSSNSNLTSTSNSSSNNNSSLSYQQPHNPPSASSSASSNKF